MNEIFTEASMANSFIYGLFNNNGEINKKILTVLQESRVLPESFVDEQMLQIERSRLSPIYDKVIKSFRDGYIRLLFYTSTVKKMTKTIPFVVHRSEKGVVASIFVSSFCNMDKDEKHIDIHMKNLYVLMESAFVALFITNRPYLMKKNTTIMKVCNEIYTSMMMRILNKDYALSIDTNLHDTVSFIISTFFLENIWEMDNKGIIANYSLQVTTEKDPEKLKDAVALYNAQQPKNIKDLFETLKQVNTRMSPLTVRYFVERYINTYGSSSILSIDYLPYLFFVIINTMLGGFLVTQATLSDIVKNNKDIKKVWAEFSKIMI